MEVMSGEDKSETPLEGSVMVAMGALQRVSSSERKCLGQHSKVLCIFL
jgi:hypothetical protein